MSTSKTATPGVYEHHPAHHFRDAEHEVDASKFGLWLFLCTEIVMFGGLFVGYALYNSMYPEIFVQGAEFLDWKLGSVNTIVLLISSFSIVYAIYSSQQNNKKGILWGLYVTQACALAFMCIKAVEYSSKIGHGLLPGKFFDYHGAEVLAENIPMYFSFYFMMTGLHGSHVLIGMGLIAWLIVRAHKGHFSSSYYTPIECVGLFWHLVDLIWIYLFPLLYLV
ncbi:MAG: cytochrome c oxidase subunit 3 family protein [Bdellovibrionales bacterium]|nr:cytochrome c oxidase subunit 3 family protein [Bdellovibrionales bacterium]